VFSPDGRWLASGVRLWDMDLDAQVQLACRTAGRNLTMFEWQLYFGRQPYRPTCQDLPTDPSPIVSPP